jgi:tetrahydromethanopterin S-methyltransferase subunit B
LNALAKADQTYYHEFIDTKWPLIFTVWPKESGVAWVAGSLASSGAVHASQVGLAIALMSSVLVTIVAGWNMF